MLSDEELRERFKEPESDWVERKASASDMRKISKTICAFANDLAGHGRGGVCSWGFTTMVAVPDYPWMMNSCANSVRFDSTAGFFRSPRFM